MASTINATPTSSGLISTADNSGVLALQTGGTTAVTVNGSQNVGIGTTSPNQKLEVLSASGGTIRLSETSSRYVEITAYGEGSANGSTMAFSTIASGTSTLTERMRIDYNGDMFVGSTPTQNGSTNTVHSKNTAKVWANVNASRVLARGFNISSVTDSGSADFTLSFTNALASDEYAVATSSWDNAQYNFMLARARGTTSVNISSRYAGGDTNFTRAGVIIYC